MAMTTRADQSGVNKEFSLRAFLAELENGGSTEFLRIREPVALDYEISATVMEMDRRKRTPVLLFENVKNSAFPILANLLGSRANFAAALGVGEGQLIEEMARRNDLVIEPVVCTGAPVQEVVDLVRHHGGQHVLHGVEGVLPRAELRPPLGEHGVLHPRGDGGGAWHVDAAEADPRPSLGRTKGEAARLAEVQADPLQRHRRGDRVTRAHASSRASNFSIRRIIPASLNSAACARSASLCGRAG